MTDATELDESAIRGRLEAATPGPWEAGERIVWSTSLDSSIDNTIVGDGPDGLGGFVDEADATFTAHARMDVVRLLEALTLQRHETSLVREARGEAMAEAERWQTRAEAAESALAAVRALADEGARASRHANGYAYVRVIDLDAALATPTTTETTTEGDRA